MILITGATGLLGSRLLFDLVSKGFQVRAMRRADSSMNCVNYYFSSQPNLFDKIEWVNADLLDIFSLESALDGVSRVYHCGGVVSFNPKDIDKMNQVNIIGTTNLVNLCIESNISKMCHVSSVAAIGRSNSINEVDETVVWKSSKNNSAYAVSKYGAEREVWRGVAEGLNAVIVNPGIIVGPGNWKTDSSVLFSRMNKGLAFYTSGITGFVDVKDVSALMIQLMESNISSERFILVGENISYRSVMNLIAEQLNVKKPTIYAGQFLSALAWRVESFKSILFGTSPVITKETARSASVKNNYINKKIVAATNYQFQKMENSIGDTADAFKKKEKIQP